MIAAANTVTPSKQLAPPTLRRARLDDYPQIEKLESSLGLLALAARDWREMWLDNPVCRQLGDRWPIGWVLEDSAGRVVGSLANVPTRYRYRGQELIAATGRAWAVLPEYRGVALWLMDEYFNQQSVDLFVNNTVNALAVETFVTFGSVRVPLGDWESAAYFITGYRGFARAALRLKHVPLAGPLAAPAGAALRLKDALTVKSFGAPRASYVVALECAFDSRFDLFWRQLVEQNPNKLLCARDTQTLSWHFAAPIRAGHAWIFTAVRNGLLRAYCVLKRQDHPPSGLIRMRLVDYQTLEPDDDLLAPLLAAAFQRCVAQGIHVMEHVGCDLPKMRSFDQHAPYRRKLAAWPFYFSAAEPEIHKRLREQTAWDASAYDGDASL